MRRQDLAWVQNYKASPGGIGQNKYDVLDGPTRAVECNVYPLSTALIDTLGLQLVDSRLLVCDAWPGNVHSIISFDGALWDQAAPPKNYNKTHGVRSVQVVIKRRG